MFYKVCKTAIQKSLEIHRYFSGSKDPSLNEMAIQAE